MECNLTLLASGDISGSRVVALFFEIVFSLIVQLIPVLCSMPLRRYSKKHECKHRSLVLEYQCGQSA